MESLSGTPRPPANHSAGRYIVRSTTAHGRRFPTILIITALGLALLLGLVDHSGRCDLPAVCGPLKAIDTAQGRLDTALPAPDGILTIEQSFTPTRNGLSEIELILVRYGPAETPPPETSRFSLALVDDSGVQIVERSYRSADLTHNQTLTLSFPRQHQSAGRQYRLRLNGTVGNPISVWGYSLDVIETGELQLIGSATSAREMRFISRYTLSLSDAISDLVQVIGQNGRLLVVSLLFLPLPGCLMLSFSRRRRWDAAAWWGVSLALGVGVWPILWFWFSLVGGQWSAWLLWLLVAAGWAAVSIRWSIDRRSDRRASGVLPHRRKSSAAIIHGLLALLLIVTFASRLVAVRALSFPPWVDASRHALITAVMVNSGRTPTGYDPYLPIDHFPYHFGFHALSASLVMLTGEQLPTLLLYLGQLLNSLIPLTVYAAGWLMTRRRAVGLLAAFLVALPFFFPGYYVTWGRMTQLAAMLVMPVLIALTWRLGRGSGHVWHWVGLLAAGIFLIHFRVFLFYLPFAFLVWATSLRRAVLVEWIKAGGLALVLVLPRMIDLVRQTNPVQSFQKSWPGYNDFPIGYVTTGWERFYLGLAAVGLGVVVVGLFRRQRWAGLPFLLAAWVAGLFLLLAGERLGLPETLVVNLNSMYITLFLPLALFLAIVAGALWRWVAQWQWLGRSERRTQVFITSAAVLGGLAVGILGVFGWRQQINILNPQTILAQTADVPVLSWAAENLPDNAQVAVNAWQWSGVTWAGSDGGAWLLPLTGLSATTPPVDHIYSPELFARARAFNEAASAVEDWSQPAAAAWLGEQGVTHVLVGAGGGYFDPAELSRNPSLLQIYAHNGTFIFDVKREQQTGLHSR